jgi:heat shock protein HslJ
MLRAAIIGTLVLLAAAGCGSGHGGSSPSDIVGPKWTITSYVFNGAMKPVVSGATADITFADDKTVSGSGGCNSFHGSYTLDGDSIKIGPLAATQKFCADPAGVMNQEQAIMSALEQATIVAPAGSDFKLNDDAGSTMVELAPGS